MKPFTFSLLFLFLALSLSGQKKERPELAVSRINPLLKLSDPEQIVQSSDQEFKVTSHSSGILQVQEVITVMNEESDANQLYVTYDSDSKINDFYVVLYDAQGNLIRKIAKSEYKDIARADGFSVYQDSRVQYVEVAQPTYPYTIVWEYTKTIEGIEFALFPDWHPQEFAEAVARSSFTVELPEEQQLFYRHLNTGIEPQISTTAGKKRYHWSVKDLMATYQEPYAPGAYYILPKVLTAPSEFTIDKFEGSLSSWSAYGSFMQDLYLGRDELPTFVEKEVQSLLTNTASKREKIQVLYDYLQEKMRYVSVQLGIGGWQPFTATYVAENNYGDCKALTNYMMSLLKVADIKAYPALIHNGSRRYALTEDFAYPAFNHVILYVPDEDLWLECTSNHYPMGYIGEGNYNRKALLVTDEGGQLVSTPRQAKAENRELIQAEISIDSLGAARISYHSQLFGEQHESFRYLSHSYTDDKKRDWVLKQLSIPNFKLEDYRITAEEETPCAAYSYRGISSKYVSQTGNRIFIPINKISAYLSVPPKDQERKYPVISGSDFQETLEIQLKLPPGWEIESMPRAEKLIESPFGNYRLTCQREGQSLRIQREIAFHRHRGEVEDYEAFRKFHASVKRAEQSMIVVKQ